MDETPRGVSDKITGDEMTRTAESAKQIRTEIKKKFGYTGKQVSVQSENYSMGSSINVEIKTEEALENRYRIDEIARKQEKIDRCKVTGEILSGGNNFVHVGMSWDLKEALNEKYSAEALEIIANAENNEGQAVKFKKAELFYLNGEYHLNGRSMFTMDAKELLPPLIRTGLE